jgi:predicted DCC family thiol-disulfide oxidoreductase YuxK
MTIPADTVVVLFDARCRFCAGWVRFILRREPAGRIRFAPLDSAAARALVGQVVEGGSVALVDRDRSVHFRSAAALRILREVGGLWRLLYVFIAVPRPIRDWAYDIVARHRYRWFGRLDRRFQPSPDDGWRFLD